jgi:hypothetical protein
MPQEQDTDPDRNRRPEQPRSEPEIIPPPRRGEEEPRVWVSVDEHGAQRIYIARPSAFSIILALVLAGVVLVAVVLVLLGLVLFWIPVAIVVVALVLLSGTVRYYWRRLQHWLAGR